MDRKQGRGETMNHSSHRKSALVLAALLAAACSSTKMDSGAGGGSSGDLQILFSPMYSAFDGVHDFKVPAVVDNIDPNAVKWTASDPSMVDIVSDPNVGGVMISTRKAGKVTIVATAGSLRGSSLLTITQATADDWATGNMRYNNGVVLTGGVTGRQVPDGGAMKDVACTNCHGDTALMGPYRTVSHTPQQTAGFSDDDLLNIFTMGRVPVSGYFDTSVVNYNQWRMFHNWQMSAEESKGIIVYLRSLTPQAQAGMRGDFGGRRRGDGGGMGMGGNPNSDASSTD
jgi:hypothetical protein